MTTPGLYRWAICTIFLLAFSSILPVGPTWASLTASPHEGASPVHSKIIHDNIRTESGGDSLQHVNGAFQFFARSYSDKESVTLVWAKSTEALSVPARQAEGTGPLLSGVFLARN